jgi:heavy metal sensor kinase
MNTRSLRFQLTAWYASLVTGVFVLLGVLMVVGLSDYLKRGLAEAQVRRARQIADTLLVQVNETGEAYLGRQVESLYAPEINDRFIRVTRLDGSRLYVSGPPKDQSFDPTQVPGQPLFGAGDFSREERLRDHRALLIGGVHFQAPDGNRFVVEVGAPMTSITTMLDRLRLQLLIGLPIVVAMAIAGGYLLLRRALAPVDAIASKAERITQHNLTERLPVGKTGDELERLSISLNRMIARLEDAFANSKRFVADASHELRTPLTVIRGELESLAQNPHLDPAVSESLGNVLEEVERLASIVEGLVSISRLDAGEAQAEWVQFDLGELAASTADQMSLLAEDKRIKILVDAQKRVSIRGDRARLKQVIVNLLDNAIKYTPNNGSVNLRVKAENGHAVIEVADDGVGIPSEALPHIFERFFRVDKTRSRDPGGAGLGLSIVKSICTAHGAEVQVRSQPGAGSEFRVKLPLVKDNTSTWSSARP